MTPFNVNLKKLRQGKGMTQDDLAEKLYVTRQTVSGWETGRCQPDIDTLTELSQALEADIHELIYGQKPEEYPKFQRGFVVRCWVFGATVVLALLFWLFLVPILKLLRNNTYDMRYLSMAYIVPVLGWFSAGALIPNGMALVYPVELRAKNRRICWILGLVLLLPGLLVGVDFLIGCNFEYSMPFFRLFYDLVVRTSGRVFLLMILPFLSGILIFLGINGE